MAPARQLGTAIRRRCCSRRARLYDPAAGIESLIVAVAVLIASVAPALATPIDEARALHAAGQLEEALQAYRAIATDARGSAAADAGTANNNACVILMNRGDYRPARGHCESALTIRRQLNDDRGLSRTLNNIGSVATHLGDYPAARTYLQEALAINRERGDAQAQVVNYANLGVLARRAGQFSIALEHYRAAIAIAEQHASEPWATPQIQIATINQGAVLEELGAFKPALELYRRLLQSGDTLGVRRRAALQVNVGVVYRNLGDPLRALDAYQRAAESYAALGALVERSNVQLNIGLVYYLNLRRPSAAETATREALRLAIESGDVNQQVLSGYFLGRLLIDDERYGEAQELLEASLRVAEETDTPEGRWAVLEALARIAVASGEDARALDQLSLAIEEIERVRAGVLEAQLREEYFGGRRAVFVSTVEVLARLWRQSGEAKYAERALEIVQRAKNRELLEAIGEGRDAGTPLSASALRLAVGDAVALEYFIGQSHLFAWLISAAGVRMFDLGDPGPALTATTEAHAALSQGTELSPEQIRALSARLLKPFEGDLSSAGRVYVAADGALRYLPFEILTIGGTDAALIDNATISYLPSSSMLKTVQPEPTKYRRTLTAFGEPQLQYDAGSAYSAQALAISRFNLRPLPASARELATIARYLRDEPALYQGAEATEERFREAVQAGSSVVHVATHTLLDERVSNGAAILVTPSKVADGMLTPGEIAELDFKANLTVLAACRTALGSFSDSGALSSLTGSILAAGSRAVVATLWDVGDAETAAFMEQFYYELGRGRAPAVALRAAKNRFRTNPQWQRPELWSGYVLIGDTGPVTRGRLRAPAVLLLAGAGIVLLSIGFAWRYSNRRTSASNSMGNIVPSRLSK